MADRKPAFIGACRHLRNRILYTLFKKNTYIYIYLSPFLFIYTLPIFSDLIVYFLEKQSLIPS